MDWTLERVNVPRDFIVLEKSKNSYTCGRNPTNEIVCPSLVVSRKHCLFVKSDNVISVIDFKSSNGIYVNGDAIEPNVLVALKENDTIGIGSADEYRDNEPMFVYKLHKGNLNSRNLEDFDDLLTQRTSGSLNIVQISKSSEFRAPIPTHKGKTLKRNLPQRIEKQEIPVVPQKISKLNNGIDKIAGEKVDVVKTEPSGSIKSLQEEDIEEIWSTLSSQKECDTRTNGTEQNAETGATDVVKTNGFHLNRSDRMTLNIERENGSGKAHGEVESVNGKTEPRKSPSINSKDRQKLPKDSRDVVSFEEKKTEEVKISARQSEPTVQKPVTSHKTIRLCSDSFLTTPRSAADICNSKENSGINRRDKIDVPGNFEDSLWREKNGISPRGVLNGRKELEESSPRATNDSESNRCSFMMKDPAATSSPFKLKHVKQEPMTSFSIIDTVDLSDDDNDIFPSSQLFDCTTDGVSLKMENDFLPTKAEDENVFENEDLQEEREQQEEEEDIKNFFTESDAVMQGGEEIITLSDSDNDEENPWLHRLSQSQRIKEEEPEIAAAPQSPEMDFVDDLLELKRDVDDVDEKPELELPIVAKKLPKPSDSQTKPIIKSARPMTLSEIEKDVNENNDEESNSDIFNRSNSSSFTKERRTSGDRSLNDSIQSKQGTLKGPKIIEPLRLPQQKRLSLKDSLLPINRDDLDSPSTSEGHNQVRDCSVEVPKLPIHLTTKQRRELQRADKIKQKIYEEEQRIRRIKNKWAQNVPLPLGKRTIPSISKKLKIQIVNERKEKLKALAHKQKLYSVKPSVERVGAKVKAKVSTKNRGDFLINEQATATEASVETAVEASTSKLEADNAKKELPKESKKVPKKPNQAKHESKTKKEKKVPEQRRKSIERSCDTPATTCTENKVTQSMRNMSLNQIENQVPNSTEDKMEERGEKKKKKPKMKVSFSDNLVTIREYEIDPNNTMKKCTGKDALIPKEKMAGARKITKAQHPKLEEFLMHIFKWNPSWLEEQRHLKTEPPVVNYDALVPLLTSYKSYADYYNVLMPLLLLELWHGITKEFESIDKNKRRQTVFGSIVSNSVTFQPIPSTNIVLTTMLLEVLATEEDVRKQMHPVYGDLVFLELCCKTEDGKQNFLKVFAYVTQLYKSTITPNTFFNRDLLNYTTNPSGVLTYTLLTRPLKVELCVGRVLRLRCVTYLRANMRMVQALQSLPNSPLLNSIINPKIDQYQLSNPIKQSFLVTKDKLNHKQTAAVFRVTEAIVRKEPKICLVQGPPGTGKSQVIVNMVMQILYGDNRYKKKESTLRILLCAPSNAAIDEIVLRLLDRRAKLLNDRFKMVRVGMPGPMHPRVREISVEELARRDVKRTINSYQSCDQLTSSIEEEKRFLEAKMNALSSKLNSTQQNDENQIQFMKMKIADIKTRYEMINTLTQSKGNNISSKDLSKLQRNAETKILIGADIIACTLSSCYTNIMESAFGGTQKNISVCIVDEATQSCEAETLIPLMLGVNTLVLVGDPAQLPATVISQRAKKLGLDQSLFSRAQRAFEGDKNSPVIMLDVQYRMAVHISYWPNKYFYGGKLQNGIIREQPVLPFHPYRVLNLDSHQNSDKFSNTQEADFVANLIYSMINHLNVKKTSRNVSIGVITPYRNQQTLVQNKINRRLSPLMENIKIKVNTEVNTVDSFQGHERDIIIMSCVRTNGIGFLNDPQRLCVALTRAKHCLVLCGNFGTFQRDTMWRALLADAQSRKHYIVMKHNAGHNEILSQLVI